MSRLSESIEKELHEALAHRVAELCNQERLNTRKGRRRKRVSGFRHRLLHRWGDALDALEELIATCAELGDQVGSAHATQTQLFAALELLRTRAVQVAWEVHSLARAGYADGAYARWRTLHEIAVVSEFLRLFGEDVATRYFEHAHIKNRKVMREYNECQERFGYPPIPQSEIEQSEQARQELLRRYGEAFGEEWGWAAEACGKAKPSFFDLREAAGYQHWKAHFGMANHAVHGGPHGVLFRLGHPLNSDPAPLSGPSLVGLGDPIDAASISLMHTTFSFVSAVRSQSERDTELTLELEITAAIKLIPMLADRVAVKATQASRAIEKEFGRGTSS